MERAFIEEAPLVMKHHPSLGIPVPPLVGREEEGGRLVCSPGTRLEEALASRRRFGGNGGPAMDLAWRLFN